MASRVLKPGGSCLAQFGHEWYIEVLNAMSEHLDFVWVLEERFKPPHARIWHKKIFVTYKPWAWFSKGKREGKWVADSRQSGVSKKYHVWGDDTGFVVAYIEAMVEEGGLVLDPFTGGGMVPSACILADRSFIGMDIDEGAVRAAREQIEDTPRPLFHDVEIWEQLSMEDECE